jgi:hypothetical protein
MASCPICSCEGSKSHTAYEMMYGTRESFEYIECIDCGCLRIAEIPSDLNKYYPKDYYSYEASSWTDLLHRIRNRDLFAGSGRLAEFAAPHLPFTSLILSKIPRWARLLDVGCGSGWFVHNLVNLGFTNAEGVEPYLPDNAAERKARIHRCTIWDMQGMWDVVTLLDVFEHMKDQCQILRKVRSLLSPRGLCIVAQPVVSEPFHLYGVNWVQLDAPRHLFLHSVRSFRRLAERCGFELQQPRFDSTAFQFWGSEAYRKGIPLVKCSRPGLLESYKLTIDARKLNRREAGDHATFLLRPAA